MIKSKEKIFVLIVSFAIFAAGVYALFSDAGTIRTVVLWSCFAGLIIIALRQSRVALKRGKRR